MRNINIDNNIVMNEICYFLFTQMTADQCIKIYGEAAVSALVKEFVKLDNLNVFECIPKQSLSKEQKKDALLLINLIKEKRYGKNKGCTVADGRK